MDGDIDLNVVSLSRLSDESMKLLSSLLNPKKVIKNVGLDGISRYRDWRGLASLANISSQIASSIKECPDKTEKVIELWLNINSNATIGLLLRCLQQLDRYDVHDDLLDLIKTNRLIAPPTCQDLARVGSAEDNRLTFDDVRCNSPQYYHAYVLYAPGDRGFVDLMVGKLTREGLLVCTEEDLLPGFSTRIEPVVRLISERCRRIVLVYSPDFFQSSATQFSTHFAQAHGIETRNRNLIPVMYRPCTVPANLSYYQYLMYPQQGDGREFNDFFFWKKLINTVNQDTPHRFRNGTTNSESSCLSIQSISSTTNGYSQYKPGTSYALVKVETPTQSSSRFVPEKEKQTLALPDIPRVVITDSALSLPSSLHSEQSGSLSECDIKELASTTDINKECKSKKQNKMIRFISSIPRKIGKKKKAIAAAN